MEFNVVMVEAFMFGAIGFLAASLIGLGVVPLVHSRAERLTLQRLEGSVPLSVGEVQADTDALRADFAMKARRLELEVERLRDKSALLMAALSRSSDTIQRLRRERDAQTVEAIALKARLAALEAREASDAIGARLEPLFRRIYSAASRVTAG